MESQCENWNGWIHCCVCVCVCVYVRVSVTSNSRQGFGVGVGQNHIIHVGQVGVAAELLLLRQLEGDRVTQTQ